MAQPGKNKFVPVFLFLIILCALIVVIQLRVNRLVDLSKASGDVDTVSLKASPEANDLSGPIRNRFPQSPMQGSASTVLTKKSKNVEAFVDAQSADVKKIYEIPLDEPLVLH